jgi:hypothetical protein
MGRLLFIVLYCLDEYFVHGGESVVEGYDVDGVVDD